MVLQYIIKNQGKNSEPTIEKWRQLYKNGIWYA